MKIQRLINACVTAGAIVTATAVWEFASAQEMRSGAANMTAQQRAAAATAGKRKFAGCKREADAKKLAFGSRGPFIKECLARR